MRTLGAIVATALLSTLSGVSPDLARALPVENATYTWSVQLTYVGMDVVSLQNPDTANPGTFEYSDSGPGTSFSGRATTSVSDGGGLLPLTRAEAGASFENLVLIDGGEGFAGVGAGVVLQFSVTPISPDAPLDVPVPLLFHTQGFASVTGDGISDDEIRAGATLELRRLVQDGEGGEFLEFLEFIDVRATCGLALPNCPSSGLSATLDQVVAASFVPATDVGILIQRAGGLTVPDPYGTPPITLGSYSAWIDPIVTIDPSFTVEIDGVPVLASELYGVEYSANAVIPEPASAWLVGAGLLALGLRRRRRR